MPNYVIGHDGNSIKTVIHTCNSIGTIAHHGNSNNS